MHWTHGRSYCVFLDNVGPISSLPIKPENKELEGSHFKASLKEQLGTPRQLYVEEKQNMWLISRAPRQLAGATTAIAFSAFGYFQPCSLYTVKCQKFKILPVFDY